MPWVTRRQIHQGNSAISLTPRERSAYHLIVYLECLLWPYPIYSNKEWNPERAHYGRLTGMVESSAYLGASSGGDVPLFVAETKQVYYPRIQVYDQDLPVARLQTLITSGFERILQNQEDSDLPPVVYSDETSIEFVYWLLTRIIQSTIEERESSVGIRTHRPTTWALATKPLATFQWTISAYLSDAIIPSEAPGDDVPADDPGDGGGGGGGDQSAPGDGFAMPQSEDDGSLPPLDLPPPGSSPEWFEQEVEGGFNWVTFQYTAFDCGEFNEGPLSRERQLPVEANAVPNAQLVAQNGQRAIVLFYDDVNGTRQSVTLISNTLCKALVEDLAFEVR